MNKRRLIIGATLVVLATSIVIFSSIYIRSKNKINLVLNVSKNVLELNDNPDKNMYIKQSYNDIYFTETYKYNGIVSDETDIQIYEYSFDTVTESDVSLLDESSFTLLSEEEFENYNL